MREDGPLVLLLPVDPRRDANFGIDPDDPLVREYAETEIETAILDTCLLDLSSQYGGVGIHTTPAHDDPATCPDAPHGVLFCVHPGQRPDWEYQAPTLAGAVFLAMVGVDALLRQGLVGPKGGMN